MKQGEPDETTRDLAAFIGISLLTIAETVDTSVQAWEKGGTGLKQIVSDWNGIGHPLRVKPVEAVKNEDWMQVAVQSTKIAQKFNKITIAEHHRIGTPWVGAWRALK